MFPKRTTSRRFAIWLFLCVAIWTAGGWIAVQAASGASNDNPLEGTRAWARYRNLHKVRAMAVAGDPRVVWVAGMAGSQASAGDAESEAMAECQRQRQRRRIKDVCRLYATGSRVVWWGD